jgi:hypothetical protein
MSTRRSAFLVCLFLTVTTAAHAQSQADDPLYATGIAGPDRSLNFVVGDEQVTVHYVTTESGLAVTEGDILVGDAVELQNRAASATTPFGVDDIKPFGLFRRGGGALWPLGHVRYMIAPTLPSPFRVRAAIEHWETVTRITFEEISTPSGDYVLFTPPTRPTDPTGCVSSVGRIGGEQRVFLTASCQQTQIIHEIGHVMGLAHEQKRADRDTRIKIVAENVKDGFMTQFDQNPLILKDVGDYCYESAMHYSRFAFSKNGKPTIIPLVETADIGPKSELAACDKATIEASYKAEFAKRPQ